MQIHIIRLLILIACMPIQAMEKKSISSSTLVTRIPEHYFKATDKDRSDFQDFITRYQTQLKKLKKGNFTPDFITQSTKSASIDAVLSITRSQNPLIRSKETIQYLFYDQGLDINQGPCSEDDTYNALARVTDIGDTHLMNLLIDCGANIHHIVSDTSLTPLMIAVGNRKKEVVQSLLDKGADPNQVISTSNTTALAYALLLGNNEIVRLLLAKGAQLNLLKNIRAQVACLEQPGSETSQTFSDIHAVAHYTAQRGPHYAKVTRLLVDHGAQLTPQEKIRLFITEHKTSLYTLTAAIALTGVYQLYKWGSLYHFS